MNIRPNSDAVKVNWFSCTELPELAFEHDEIITIARKRLAAKMNYSTIALHFMPQKFTLTELQRVYEIIMALPLDKRNFRKRVLAFDMHT